MNISQMFMFFIEGKKTRIVDGKKETEGRLEVLYEGEWGNVCDDGFNNNGASVVCRSLGLSW